MNKDKPFSVIWLTGELEGWDSPHWAESQIGDDDIKYVLGIDMAKCTCECRTHLGGSTYCRKCGGVLKNE